MNEKPHWLDQPSNIKWLWRGFVSVLALTVLAEFWFPRTRTLRLILFLVSMRGLASRFVQA